MRQLPGKWCEAFQKLDHCMTCKVILRRSYRGPNGFIEGRSHLLAYMLNRLTIFSVVAASHEENVLVKYKKKMFENIYFLLTEISTKSFTKVNVNPTFS